MGNTKLLDDYLTDEQLAKSYKKSVRTIKRWRREGNCPPSFRHGNEEITHVDDAAAFLEAKRQAARDANGAKKRAS